MSISASPSYAGSISCSGCTGVSSNTASISASPYSGYQISGWSIGSCGTSSSCSTQTDSYKTVTVYFTQTPPAYYLSNFSVCDASSGGNCGSTVYGNGTAYYKFRTANSGGSGGTFNGHVTLNGGNWVAVSSYIGSGSYADFAPGVSSGTGTYTFGACQDNLVGCTGGTAVTFISRPSLGGPSSVSSGGSATFTVSYDSAKTPTYSSYSCGTGGSFVSSSGATFTCSYVNNGGSAITASPSVTVSQGGISTTVSTSVTVNPVFYLSVSKSGSGTVTGTGISCGGTCATYLTQGTSVSLSASPASGYVFSNWSGDCSGSGSCSLTMNSGHSVTANFTRVYNISASAGSGGTVSCSGCGGSVSPGATVSVTATPSSSLYYTSGWSGLGSACSGNSCSITASADGTITASFTAVTVSGALSPSSATAMTGQTRTFTPSRTGGTASGTVTFSGQSCGGGAITNINTTTGAFDCGYSTSGTFTPSAVVSQQGVSATPTASITISPFTDSFTLTSPANGTTYNPGQTFTVSGTISTYYNGYRVQASTDASSEGSAGPSVTPTSPQAFTFTTSPLTAPSTGGPHTVTVYVSLDYSAGFGWGGNIRTLAPQTFTINVLPAPSGLGVTPFCYNDQGVKGNFPFHEANGLSWTGASSASGYYVYRRNVTANTGFVKLTQRGCANLITGTGCTEGLYTQSDGYISVDYEYKVTAANSSGLESAASNTVFQQGYSDGRCPVSTSAPDLTAGSLSAQFVFGSGTPPPSSPPNTFYAGSSIKLTGIITNGGTAGTGVGFKNSWQKYDTASTPTSVSQYVGGQVGATDDMAALGTGASLATALHTIPLPPLPTGVAQATYYYGVCPDSAGAVPELLESNNCSAPIAITVKKLYIPNVSLYVSKDSTCGTGATAQTIAGTQVTLCWKVNAQ